MTFLSFGRTQDRNDSNPVSLSSNHRIVTPTSHPTNNRGSNGNGANGHGTNGHQNGNGSDVVNGNTHVSRDGNGHVAVNGNGHANGYAAINGGGDGHANGNGNGHAKPNRFCAVPASLSAGVSIKGTIKFRSELVIDGEIEGTIDSGGRLTVGRNGRVRGDIRTRSATIHGTVDGNLSAGEKCELRSGCTLRGDVETSRLVVEENVNFTGNAAISTRDYLAEMRCPNGKGSVNGNVNGNGNH